MNTPEHVIAHSIWFDHNVTGNANRILQNLREEGYEIVPIAGSLPEIQRMYGASVSSEHATFWIDRAHEEGLALARQMAKERDERHAQLIRAEAERDHLRRALSRLLIPARGSRYLLGQIHAALDWRPEKVVA